MRVQQAARMQTDTIDVWCQGPFGIPELAATLQLAVRGKLRRQNRRGHVGRCRVTAGS